VWQVQSVASATTRLSHSGCASTVELASCYRRLQPQRTNSCEWNASAHIRLLTCPPDLARSALHPDQRFRRCNVAEECEAAAAERIEEETTFSFTIGTSADRAASNGGRIRPAYGRIRSYNTSVDVSAARLKPPAC